MRAGSSPATRTKINPVKPTGIGSVLIMHWKLVRFQPQGPNMTNKENTPEFDPTIDYALAKKLYAEANAAIWQLEELFKKGSTPRFHAYEARACLGATEDHILRCLGIRGN